MIFLGLDDAAKVARVAQYRADHPEVNRVVVLQPTRFRLPDDAPYEHVDYAEATFYRVFYPLMETLDKRALLVVNECLRTQNRHDLTYNCFRNYVHRTPHVLVFQYLPLIDTIDDFMVLFDFATDSRWKREPFRADLLREAQVHVTPVPLTIEPVRVPVDDKVRAAYAKEKASLLADVRGDPDKDPHQIPRNLLLVSGKAKVHHVDPRRRYVGRNNRLKLPSLETYRDAAGAGERVVFELPHNHLDMVDFLTVSRQHRVDVLVADTKADEWYLRRFQDWVKRANDAAAALHG